MRTNGDSAGHLLATEMQAIGMHLRMHRIADALDVPGEVAYFVGAKDGPVKIGWTGRIALRIKELRRAYDNDALEVLATCSGGCVRENAYHLQFEQHRLHGEWFTRCPEIEAEVSRLTATLESRA